MRFSFTNKPTLLLLTTGLIAFMISLVSSCAQISMPTGGDRDSLPPVLVKASPAEKSLNVTSTRITLTFDEYIGELQELQKNLLVSPVQKANPVITSNLKTITIRLRDSLLPNTTYSINFGDAIRDVNENNTLRSFTYIFSTGNTIDSLTLDGQVTMAETGKVDSTVSVLLYRNADDSSVLKRRPDYLARLDGSGNFHFENLPAATFKIYALKDGDGGRTYNTLSEAFAFRDTNVVITANNNPVKLLAYVQEKAASLTGTPKPAVEKKLRYGSSLIQRTQDLLTSLELTFNNKISLNDTVKIILADSNYLPLNMAAVSIDSSKKILRVTAAWKPETDYTLIIPKNAVRDSLGGTLSKNDTLRFKTKRVEDYGNVVLRFKNLDLTRQPVLQFMEGELVKYTYPVTSSEWTNNRFPPGEYELRILYDTNKNGKWDPGNYSKKLQPERVIALPQKLGIRPDWDNERDIIIDN
ncbi:MAG: hypothetical protein JWQ27_2495 [Ferruginibacter sp.]|nr:hypothetical protein [Ferruginibacter sp.]